MENKNGNGVTSPTLKYGSKNYDRSDYLPSQTSKQEETSDMGQYVPDDAAATSLEFLLNNSSQEKENPIELTNFINEFKKAFAIETDDKVLEAWRNVENGDRVTPYLKKLYKTDPIAQEFIRKTDIQGLYEYLSNTLENFKYGDLMWIYDFFREVDLVNFYREFMYIYSKHYSSSQSNDENSQEDDDDIKERMLVNDYHKEIRNFDFSGLYKLSYDWYTLWIVRHYLTICVQLMEHSQKSRN